MAVKAGYKQATDHVQKRIESRIATLRTKPKPVSKEWLEHEYVTLRRDCVQIGAELGKDPTTIRAWLVHYGIPTRPRGGATAPGSFRKGQPNGFAGRKHSPQTRERLRQASLNDGRVPYLKDGEHWLRGVTGPDHPSWQGGITPERQAFYATEEWKQAVRAVWARAQGRCERCHLHYSEVRHEQKFHVHHIVGFAVRELRSAVDNLALLCVQCHRFVHSRGNVDRQFLGVRECG